MDIEIAVFGSCMIDFISYVDRFPLDGETLHSNKFETGYGGKGANQVVAAAKLGAKTALIAKLGQDPYGIKYLQQLKDEGVDTNFVELKGEHTGVALIVVSSNGQNQIVINSNANQYLTTADAVKAQALLDNVKVLVCQLEVPLEGTIFALQNCKGISILNGAPAMMLSNDVLKVPDIFCVNEIEAKNITDIEIADKKDAKKAIEKLRAKGCKMVIITLGALGAAFNINDKIYHGDIPIKVVAVECVGAGDAFIGALAFYIAKYPNCDWFQKIGASLEIATHSVQFLGTQTSYKDFPKIDLSTKSYQFNEI